MPELISNFTVGQFIALVAIVGGLVCGTLILITIYWHDLRKAEIAANLKKEMLDRGMSADEICAVIEAGTGAAGQFVRPPGR